MTVYSNNLAEEIFVTVNISAKTFCALSLNDNQGTLTFQVSTIKNSCKANKTSRQIRPHNICLYGKIHKKIHGCIETPLLKLSIDTMTLKLTF